MSTIEKNPARGMNAALSRVLRGQASEAGLSYDELAEAVGVSKSTINRVLKKEGATRHLDAALIEAICRATGADVVEVWVRAARMVDRPPSEDVESVPSDVAAGTAAYRRGRADVLGDTPEKVDPPVTPEHRLR